MIPSRRPASASRRRRDRRWKLYLVLKTKHISPNDLTLCPWTNLLYLLCEKMFKLRILSPKFLCSVSWEPSGSGFGNTWWEREEESGRHGQRLMGHLLLSSLPRLCEFLCLVLLKMSSAETQSCFRPLLGSIAFYLPMFICVCTLFHVFVPGQCGDRSAGVICVS